VLVFLVMVSGDYAAHFLVLLASLPGAGWPGRPDVPVVGRPRRRLRSGCGALCRVPGLPHQRLAAPGDVFVGEKPSGEPVERAEEKLEAQTNERALAPMAGNDALFENSQGQAYGCVLHLGDAARYGGGIHGDRLPLLVC